MYIQNFVVTQHKKKIEYRAYFCISYSYSCIQKHYMPIIPEFCFGQILRFRVYFHYLSLHRVSCIVNYIHTRYHHIRLSASVYCILRFHMFLLSFIRVSRIVYFVEIWFVVFKKLRFRALLILFIRVSCSVRSGFNCIPSPELTYLIKTALPVPKHSQACMK